jgi:F-type H+-transporting ATPase subunit gamma
VAGGQERILRGRIKSVQATKKITRAMELIAASRIVKAQQRVVAAVPYSDMITEVVRDLSAAGAGSDAPLLAGRAEVKNVCYVVLSADRGLCGGYNSGVLRATEGEIKEDALKGRGHTVVAIGRKAEGYFRFRGYNIAQSFTGFTDSPFTRDQGIVSYGFDPIITEVGEATGVHGNDERIRVDAFRRGVSDMRAIVRDVVYN